MKYTREKEAAMITNERQWPGETLCLKKRPGPGEVTGVMGYSSFGVLTNSRAPFVIYLRPDFVNEKHYDTVEALLDDGWIVD